MKISFAIVAFLAGVVVLDAARKNPPSGGPSVIDRLFIDPESRIAANLEVLKGEQSAELRVELLRYGNRSYAAFQTEVKVILEARRQEDVPRALNKLLGSVVFIVLYVVETACSDLVRLFDTLYWILDCVFEISAIDVCTIFYNCKTGIIAPSAINANDFTPEHGSGSRSRSRSGSKSRGGKGRDKRNTKPERTSDRTVEKKNKPAPGWAIFLEVQYGKKSIYVWTSYLFILVEEVIRVVSQILGVPVLILCPHKRYPPSLQKYQCLGPINTKNYPKYLIKFDLEIRWRATIVERLAYYLARVQKTQEAQVDSQSEAPSSGPRIAPSGQPGQPRQLTTSD